MINKMYKRQTADKNSFAILLYFTFKIFFLLYLLHIFNLCIFGSQFVNKNFDLMLKHVIHYVKLKFSFEYIVSVVEERLNIRIFLPFRTIYLFFANY